MTEIGSRGAESAAIDVVKETSDRHPPHVKSFGLTTLSVLLASTMTAAAPPSSLSKKLPDERGEGEFVFSILPKAFQKNPLVNMTVITEMTTEGKQLTPPTPEKPIYYLGQAGGYHVEGHPANETPPPPAEVERSVQKALAATHYLPAPEGHAPQLLLLFHWGAHNHLDSEFPDLGHKNTISRAALAGGKKFSEEFARALDDEDTYKEAGSYGMFGDTLSPLRLFKDKNARNTELVEQSMADCYYVAVSAYDYARMTRGEKILLWRTKMTVDARGISMSETFPTLIATGGTYFGREMEQAVTPIRRVPRQGRVQVGTPQVVKDPPAAETLPVVKERP